MNRIFKGAIALSISLSLLLTICIFPVHADSSFSPGEIKKLTVFPAELSRKIPADIPLYLQQEEELEQQNFPALQRVFDIHSWQSFIAINWPLNSQDIPQPRITDPGIPRWETWHESLDVFRPDGSDPVGEAPRHYFQKLLLASPSALPHQSI